MAKKELSKRGARRKELREKLQDATYNQIAAMVNAGKLAERDLREYYSDAFAKARKAINRIEKSDVGFFDGKPDFSKGSELKNLSDLIHSAADVNNFLKGKSYGGATIKKRRESRDKAIATLNKHGITSVNKSNFEKYARFMTWFQQAGYDGTYDSDAPEILEVFKQGEDSIEWKELIDKIML